MSAHTRTTSAVLTLVDGRKGPIGLMSLTSLLGGVMEAAFLVVVTRTAFAIAQENELVAITKGQTWPPEKALWVALALVLARVAFALYSNRQAARIATGVVADIRTDMAGAFLHASWAVQQRDRAGKLQELLTSFANGAAGMINGVVGFLNSAFSLAALLGIAVLVDPGGSLIVIAAVGVLAMLLRPIRGALRRRAADAAAAGMGFATSLSETSQLGLEVHVFHVQDEVERRVGELISHNQRVGERLSLLRMLVPTLYTALAFVVLVGALAIATVSSATDLSSLGAVMLVMMRSLSYGQAVQTNSALVIGSVPFVETLNEELGKYRSAEVHDLGQAVDQVGDLTLEGVEFEYTNGQPVLTGVQATIHAGSIVGIVGPSGSGKSTLVQLLLGLRQPTTGRVLSNGRPLAQFSRESWARKVTFVPQSSHLIRGSIAENIRFMRADISQEAVEAAAKLAHLHEDIVAMRGGYDQEVGGSSGGLSGGQVQRLSIARALIERPDVLILDEPTSSLDVRSEALIRQTLSTLRERMTIIVIAHRMSTLEICDEIIVIQGGRLVAQGPPATLERSNEFYREALELSGLR